MLSGLVSLIGGIIGLVVGLIGAVIGMVVGILVPLIVCVLVPLAILGVPLLIVMAVVWLLGLSSSRRDKERMPEETRIMQEVHRGLARMQNRLDALETIIVNDEARSHPVR